MTDTDTLDTEVRAVLAHAEAHRARRERKDLRADDPMTEVLNKTYARLDKQWRKQHEHVEIRVFEC